MTSYKDLQVYQKSYERAKEIYEISSRFPVEERYGLASQIKRAATSIPLNIAEGYGKGSGGKELKRFLEMARGSCAEMEVLIAFVKDFRWITETEGEKLTKGYEEIGRMLTGLIKAQIQREAN